jgi:GR25 family glycosyltransferase involved in LPS biosynthesis
MKIDKTYVIHYEPLVERKQYLDAFLPSITDNFDFIVSSKETDDEMYINSKEYYNYNPTILNRILSISEISVSVSHLKIYEDILKNNYDWCLILEDDAVITENFNLIIKNILKENIADFDFIFLSTCCGIVFNKLNNGYVQSCPMSKCVSGYLVNRKKLKDVLSASKPISTNIDNHLNIIKEPLGLNFGSCEPPIITQGSETKYKSNLR